MSRMPHNGVLRPFVVALVAISCTEKNSAVPTGPGANRSAPVILTALSSPGWQQQARTLVGTNRLTAYAAGRLYALLSVAQYRAVVDVDAQFAHGNGELGHHSNGLPSIEARRGAVAGASAQVLAYVFPAEIASFEKQVEMEAESALGNTDEDFTRGLSIGRAAGDAVVERAKADHFNDPWVGHVPVGDGMWLADGPPAGTSLLGATPWLLESRDQLRPPPPPAFGSPEFLTARDEIRTLSHDRTADQLAIALYWNLPAGTFTLPGYWNHTAADYVESYGFDERAATHVFALMHAAMYDAQIACWDAKFQYWLLRPSQADPEITLTFALPNHPSYPSGHSCISGAAATVLGHFFPDRLTELSDWVIEVGLSRIYAGIHYRFDVETGSHLGKTVAEWAIGVDESTGLLATTY